MGLLDWLRDRLTPGWRSTSRPSHDKQTTRKAIRASIPGIAVDASAKAEERDQLVMGVDVGTTLSKVVVSLRGRHVAVPFDAAGGGTNPYLLPTAVAIMDTGECRLGLHESADKYYDDIKKPLIDGKIDEGERLPLIAFLALLFQQVQNQIDKFYGSLLGERIDWLVNLGVPTESFGGGSRGERDLVGAYRSCAEAAWALVEQIGHSGSEEPLTIARCQRAMQCELGKKSGRVSVFPEIVPQVASYVKSKQRREGVHIFVDVGGGTLDVTAFQILSTNLDSEKVPVLARIVQPLGTRYLLDHICKEFDSSIDLPPFSHFPSEEDIATDMRVSGKDLRKVMESFHRRVVDAIRKAIPPRIPTVDSRMDGEPFNLQWPGTGFVGGGGAFVDLYKDAVKRFTAKDFVYRVNWVPLPRPEELEASEIDDAHWHRLAVAYGLSFDPFDIASIKPPEEIEPVPPRYWQPPDDPPPLH